MDGSFRKKKLLIWGTFILTPAVHKTFITKSMCNLNHVSLQHSNNRWNKWTKWLEITDVYLCTRWVSRITARWPAKCLFIGTGPELSQVFNDKITTTDKFLVLFFCSFCLFVFTTLWVISMNSTANQHQILMSKKCWKT